MRRQRRATATFDCLSPLSAILDQPVPKDRPRYFDEHQSIKRVSQDGRGLGARGTAAG